MIYEMSILPLYGQVSVSDVGTVDLPDWGTGDEPAIFSEHAVVVATRSDFDGEVTITILEDDGNVDGQEVFAGEISCTTPAIEVGSIVAANLVRIPLARIGNVRVRVFVEPAGAPAYVSVLLEPGIADTVSAIHKQ